MAVITEVMLDVYLSHLPFPRCFLLGVIIPMHKLYDKNRTRVSDIEASLWKWLILGK